MMSVANICGIRDKSLLICQSLQDFYNIYFLDALFTKFLVLINIALTSAQTQCHERQFLSTFTGGCSDCPDDPKTNCKYEGGDAQPCEQACITDEPSVESSTGINSGEAVGIAVGVLLLVLILLGLACYFYRNGYCVRNHAREHGDSGESTTVNIHTVPPPSPSSPSSPSSSPPSSPADDQHLNVPMATLELGKDQGL